jgi:hypothetical protein
MVALVEYTLDIGRAPGYIIIGVLVTYLLLTKRFGGYATIPMRCVVAVEEFAASESSFASDFLCCISSVTIASLQLYRITDIHSDRAREGKGDRR